MINTQRTPPKFISYLRVSTESQLDKQLSIDAQRAKISEYINQEGGELVTEYQEVSSGTNDNRPVLKQVIEHVRLSGGTLSIIVVRIDRLARSVLKIAELQAEGIDFVSVTENYLNGLNATLISAFSSLEAKLISDRTKDALQQAKRKGTKLGSPVLPLIRCTDVEPANKTRSETQRTFRIRMIGVIETLENQGYDTCVDIAAKLNRMSLCTYYGKSHTVSSVSRLRRER
jgi:DNA invertase Pin-like site-specific DNA recombinase